MRSMSDRRPISTSSSGTRIAVVSDIHLSVANTEEAAQRRTSFDGAVEAVNVAQPDVVIMPGDLTENGRSEEFAAFRHVVARFVPPVHFLPGNHDIGDKWLAGRSGVTPERIGSYEAAMGPSRYACTVAGLRLVTVNASLLGSGLAEEDTQWQWLEAELDGPCREHRIIALHYPLYRDTPDEPAGDYWTVEIEPRLRLLELAAAHRVRIVLSGHLHAPIARQYRGMALITAPSIAFGLPFGVQARGWMLVTVDDAGVDWEIRSLETPSTSSQPERTSC